MQPALILMGYSVSNQPKKFFYNIMPSQIFMIFGVQAYLHEKKLHSKL